MKKIHNLRELADHLGVDYEEPFTDAQVVPKIARRLYKDTDCGVSFGTCMVGGKRCTRTWVAWVKSTIYGPSLINLRPLHGKTLPPFVEGHAPLPEEVVSYLNLVVGPGGVYYLDDFKEDNDGFRALKTDDNLLRMNLVDELHTVVTFRVDSRTKSRPGVYVSSIIEGSDAEVPPVEIAFPFTPEAFDAVVKGVEFAADDLWNETHGCEGCAKLLEVEYECGPTPVHEDCLDCGGDGEVV